MQILPLFCFGDVLNSTKSKVLHYLLIVYCCARMTRCWTNILSKCIVPWRTLDFCQNLFAGKIFIQRWGLIKMAKMLVHMLSLGVRARTERKVGNIEQSRFGMVGTSTIDCICYVNIWNTAAPEDEVFVCLPEQVMQAHYNSYNLDCIWSPILPSNKWFNFDWNTCAGVLAHSWIL